MHILYRKKQQLYNLLARRLVWKKVLRKLSLFISHAQNAGQITKERANKYFENVVELVSLRMTLTNKNLKQNYLTNSLNLGTISYNSVGNFFS
jgi:hypothetical protein